MSRRKKLERSIKRKAAKAARKEANRRKYEAWKAAGTNQKRKQYEQVKMHGHDHPRGPCGNIGCSRCNPAWYNTKTPIELHAELHSKG